MLNYDDAFISHTTSIDTNLVNQRYNKTTTTVHKIHIRISLLIILYFVLFIIAILL
jgi:hypothetical protein